MNTMMETNINFMTDNEQIKEGEDDEEEEEDPSDKKQLEILNVKTNRFIDIYQPSSIFFIFIFIPIIPILQVVVGWHYSNACPINQSIPYYLIVAGIVGLLLVILISASQLMTRTMASVMFDEAIDRANPNRATMLVGCGVCSIMCISLSLFVFLFGWSIAGWTWVLEVWHRVQYQNETNKDYCHPVVYKFTLSLLIIKIMFELLLFYFLCKKSCPRIMNIRRQQTVNIQGF